MNSLCASQQKAVGKRDRQVSLDADWSDPFVRVHVVVEPSTPMVETPIHRLAAIGNLADWLLASKAVMTSASLQAYGIAGCTRQSADKFVRFVHASKAAHDVATLHVTPANLKLEIRLETTKP